MSLSMLVTPLMTIPLILPMTILLSVTITVSLTMSLHHQMKYHYLILSYQMRTHVTHLMIAITTVTYPTQKPKIKTLDHMKMLLIMIKLKIINWYLA